MSEFDFITTGVKAMQSKIDLITAERDALKLERDSLKVKADAHDLLVDTAAKGLPSLYLGNGRCNSCFGDPIGTHEHSCWVPAIEQRDQLAILVYRDAPFAALRSVLEWAGMNNHAEHCEGPSFRSCLHPHCKYVTAALTPTEPGTTFKLMVEVLQAGVTGEVIQERAKAILHSMGLT